MFEHERFVCEPEARSPFRLSASELERSRARLVALIRRAQELRSPTWIEKLVHAVSAVDRAQLGTWSSLDAMRAELLDDVVWCNVNARGTVFDQLALEAYDAVTGVRFLSG